jgi:hypothetical protein
VCPGTVAATCQGRIACLPRPTCSTTNLKRVIHKEQATGPSQRSLHLRTLHSLATTGRAHNAQQKSAMACARTRYVGQGTRCGARTTYPANLVATEVDRHKGAAGCDGVEDTGSAHVPQAAPRHVQPAQANQDTGHIPSQRTEGKRPTTNTAPTQLTARPAHAQETEPLYRQTSMADTCGCNKVHQPHRGTMAPWLCFRWCTVPPGLAMEGMGVAMGVPKGVPSPWPPANPGPKPDPALDKGPGVAEAAPAPPLADADARTAAGIVIPWAPPKSSRGLAVETHNTVKHLHTGVHLLPTPG